VVFSDEIDLFIPPKKGSRHVLRLIRELLYFKKNKRRTDICQALDYINKVIRKRATVFVVSDFIETGFKKSLSLLSKHHDVIAVPVGDRAETALEKIGLIEFEDAETGETIIVDTSTGKFRKEYEKLNCRSSQELKQMFNSIDVDYIDISTDRNYVQDLIKFFHMRHKRY